MKAYWDFPRDISIIRALLAVGASHGLDQSVCLENSDISPDCLSILNYEVEAWQEMQVIRNLVNILGSDIPLGIEAGFRHHITTFGAFGFGILSSASARAALNLAFKYLRLTCTYCRLEIVEEGDKTFFLATHDELPADIRRFLVERDCITVLSLQREILPMQLPIISLDIAFPPAVYADKLNELTGYVIKFDQPRTCIVIESQLLDLPLPQADPYILARYEAECQQLLARRDTMSSYARQIRDHLLMQSVHFPVIKDMAQQMGVNTKTLQRRLANEGTSYKAIVDNVREDLATDLLNTKNLSMDEIAELLGYSEVSSFARAFKRWKGVYPFQFKRQKK
ncbi:AraC family transcriptional regulator [Acinetobacter junii]|uniref:AraC family transcriptional regulator n=1 Tax=Acinetobacter junii TaxID=40215 RepID=UPI003214367D